MDRFTYYLIEALAELRPDSNVTLRQLLTALRCVGCSPGVSLCKAGWLTRACVLCSQAPTASTLSQTGAAQLLDLPAAGFFGAAGAVTGTLHAEKPSNLAAATLTQPASILSSAAAEL